MEQINIFDKNKIKANLGTDLSSSFELKVYRSLDSTNNEAKKYIQKNNVKKVIFAADIQNSGRGRRGHSWFSDDPASVSVSFLYKAGGNLNQIPQITAAAALAVNKTLKKFRLAGDLKWPNDILIKNKKICGILSELIFNKNQEAFVVIGCGINLNNKSFSQQINELATSYYLEKNKKINKNLFLAELIAEMDYYIESYLSESREKIINEWKKELNLIGKKVDLTFKGQKYKVQIKDVLDSGELLAIFDNGREKKLQSLYTSLDYQSLLKYNKDN